MLSGAIQRIGPKLFFVCPFWLSSFSNRLMPKSEIFGSLFDVSKMLRAAKSRWTMLWLWRCSSPRAMPLISRTFSLIVNATPSSNSFLSRLPPSQNSSTMYGSGPSTLIPNVWTTFGWGGRPLLNDTCQLRDSIKWHFALTQSTQPLRRIHQHLQRMHKLWLPLSLLATRCNT